MVQQHEDRQPGTQRFRIWVEGRLGEHFSDGLAGIEQEDVPAGTLLHGEMIDRSQLHSTLDLLRSLGIDVVRFEVDPPQKPGDAHRRIQETAERPEWGTGQDIEESP